MTAALSALLFASRTGPATSNVILPSLLIAGGLAVLATQVFVKKEG